MNSEVSVKLSAYTKLISVTPRRRLSKVGHVRKKSMLASGLTAGLTLTLICGLAIGSYSSSVAAQSFDDGVEAYLAGRYKSALQIWEPLAAEDDAVAMFNIGVLHAQGLGVKQDPVVAVDWYRQAADRGYAPAQFNLGASYHNGQGVERDDELAASWWQLAADQGEVQAQYHLAVLYLEGRGVALDETTARYFLEQAARQGDSRATETLNTLVDSQPQEVSRTVSVSEQSDESPETVTGIVADSGEATISETIEETTIESNETGSDLVVANGSTELVTPVVVEDADNAVVADEPRIVTAENGSTVIYTTESAEMRAAESSSWVNDRDPNSYTIQLLATKERAAAEKFIVEQNLEGRAQIFFAGTGDVPLYKVIYGNYISAAEANKERKSFPGPLMKNTPWIRDFGSIQAEAIEVAAGSSSTDVLPDQTVVDDTNNTSGNASGDASLTSEGTASEVVTEVIEQEPVTETTAEAVVEQVIESESVESSVVENVETVVIVSDSVESETPEGIIVGEINTESTVETVSESVILDTTTSDTGSENVTETVQETVLMVEENPEPAQTETVTLTESGIQEVTETVVESSDTESSVESNQTVVGTDTEQSVVIDNPVAENAPLPQTNTTVGNVDTRVIGTVSDEDSSIAVQPPVSGADQSSEEAVESFTLGQRAFNRQDYESALGHWRPLAESGHAEAQYGLGFMYETGWGVQRTANEALQWYRKSAEQGYAKAQYNLGMMYLVGNGVPADESMGLFWIQSAADQNDLRARARLSRMRANGASSTN